MVLTMAPLAVFIPNNEIVSINIDCVNLIIEVVVNCFEFELSLNETFRYYDISYYLFIINNIKFILHKHIRLKYIDLFFP
jgi:hypothetical protein